ncbi:MAG: DNA primase [Candidatus Symbiothrix sp.]|jgi:DNA primase catalytic core|nr:DNA primase [Candidatus Symbiothrix sp.]
MIEQAVIDRITEAAGILDVVGDFVKLHKRGVNYLGLCPFHEDHTPSFWVSPAKNICKCFSCGKGGNPVNFLMEHEGISYPEALKAIGKKYNIEVEDRQLSPEEKAGQNRRENLRSVLNFAQKLFEKNLSDSEDARAYLSERHIFPATFRKFGAGLACSGQMPQTLSFNSLSLSLALAAGILRQDEQGGYRDYFWDRITFPYCDLYGNITGFTGRTLNPAGNPKYLNTPETELFTKGNVLFGLYQARDAIRKADSVYIVEGQFDVMAMAQAGMNNTVCASGSSFSPGQIKLLKRFTQNVTLVYDGDDAGRKAALRNGEQLLAAGMNVRVASLPDGADPDSFLHDGNDPALFTDESRQPDFISCKYEHLLSLYPEADPIRRTEIYRSVAESIALVPDGMARKSYISHLAVKYRADGELITEAVREHLAGRQERPEAKKPGFYGLQEAGELISKENPAIILTGDMNSFAKLHGEKPAVYYFGEINYSHIQELIRISTQIEFIDPVYGIQQPKNLSRQIPGGVDRETLEESPPLPLLKNLHRAGFGILLSNTYSEDGEENSSDYGFLDYYIITCGQLAEYYKTNVKKRSVMIERAAEMLSCIPDTERNAGIKQYCKYFDITSKVMNDTLKPYLDKKKSKSRFQSENLTVDGETLNIDPGHPPDYVDPDFFQQYGFFPLQIKSGRCVAYIFRDASGALIRVGNFHMTPLFHVYDKTGANKRVVRLDHMQMKNPVFVEWPSKDMLTLNTFRQLLWEEGGFIFENGNINHLNKILSSVAMQFRKCFELKVFGRQPEDFYAFSNAIYHLVDGVHRIDYVDEYGIVSHGDVNYYAPAFSKIYAGERKDNDRFAQDRYFMYKDIPEELKTDFATWASLVGAVYKQNGNGKWALLFAVMSAFRSVIYPIDRLFTSLFFVGPTESGKSQIAISIRSLFIHPDAALFNLNSGTDAAFFTAMERYRDVPVIFEEYNDNSISDPKFQGLKAAVYDGEGKQKRKDASSRELDTSQVNSVPILLGQESPQKDDGSLYNRIIVCEVPKKDDWTDGERKIFQDLKEREKRGLSSVLIEVLKIQPLVSQHFKSIQRACFKELKEDIRTTHGALEGQTRILNTVSLFLSICRLLEEHAPHLKLPFSYGDFFKIAREKVIKQAESISSTNRLAVYFSSIMNLIEHGSLLYGRELKIEQPVKLKIMANRKETTEVILPTPETRVLYLRIPSIHPQYAKMHQPKDILNESSLAVNLASHPSYIGHVKAVRFKWNTVREVPAGDGDLSMRKIVQPQEANTSAVALNYDILKELMDIDLERFISIEKEKEEKKEGEKEYSGREDLPF